MLSIPAVEMEGLPTHVTVYEVGARDGLQNESTVLPVHVKAEFIRRLGDAGLGVVEATSLVRPDLVPALADGDELLGLLDLQGPVRHPVLVPNLRGLDRALSLGVQEIAVFASATEAFAQRNLGRGLEESLASYEVVVGRAKEAGLRVRGYISMCWADPWEGAVDPYAVVAVAERLRRAGTDEISLGDTIGAATPGAVVRLLNLMLTAGIGPDVLAVHFHDTYGQALVNTLTALKSGRHDGGLVGRRTRRLPVRQERDRQPGDGGSRLDAGRARYPHRGRPGLAGAYECLDVGTARATEPVRSGARAGGRQCLTSSCRRTAESCG